ncbi:UNVERIFIED_CONTAM: hypothetical protein FKN15_008752 [Acipenser sinensis]
MACCLWVFLSLCLLLLIAPDEGFLQDVTFSQTQRLSMKILKDVRSLRVLYNEVQFGNQLTQDSAIVMPSLPSASMPYTHWLSMKDEERLVSSSQDLHVYWVHVHANRMHLLGELEQSQLAQSMLAMQMDLSDLTLQVNSQEPQTLLIWDTCASMELKIHLVPTGEIVLTPSKDGGCCCTNCFKEIAQDQLAAAVLGCPVLSSSGLGVAASPVLMSLTFT